MKRSALSAFALSFFLALPSSAADPAGRQTYERTHPFGEDRESKVGIRQGPVSIDSVRIRNWPDSDDLRDAEKDRSDTHTIVVEFEYSNRDENRDWKCRYTVTIKGRDGETWAENDRKATLDKGKMGDTNRVFVKMKTRHYREARSFKVRYEIWRD